LFNNIGWQRVLGLFIAYYITLSFFNFAGYISAGLNFMNHETPTTTNQHLIISFFGFIGTNLIIWVFMKYLNKERFITLGFSQNISQFITGLVLGSSIFILSFIFLVHKEELQIITVKFNLNEILKTSLLFLLIAFTEEVLFRGYILKNLMISFNPYVALTISAILFTFMHSGNPNMSFISFIGLFLAGIFLGISYVYTKSLWFPISLHFSWNLSQTLIGFNVSGLDVYSIITFKLKENTILNGGDFGFEGSILSLIIQLTSIICIIIYYKVYKVKI